MVANFSMDVISGLNIGEDKNRELQAAVDHFLRGEYDQINPIADAGKGPEDFAFNYYGSSKPYQVDLDEEDDVGDWLAQNDNT